MQKLLLVLSLASLVSFTAQAQESEQKGGETGISQEEVQKGTQKPGQDIDEEITNARLRASTGSKSKMSVRMSLGYDGGTIKDPFGKDRPPLVGDPTTREKAALNADIAMKYRMSKNWNLALGGGLGMPQVFHGSQPDDETGEDTNPFDRMEANNPYLEISRVGKVGRFQMVSDITSTFYTTDQSDKTGTQAEFALNHNMLTTVGKAKKLTMGIAGVFASRTFDEELGDVPAGVDHRWALYPYAEYSLNDTFALRTVFGWFNYFHSRDESKFMSFSKGANYQSIGLATSISRDVYLYPNIQFIADGFNADRTNVALSANINLF